MQNYSCLCVALTNGSCIFQLDFCASENSIFCQKHNPSFTTRTNKAIYLRCLFEQACSSHRWVTPGSSTRKQLLIIVQCCHARRATSVMINYAANADLHWGGSVPCNPVVPKYLSGYSFHLLGHKLNLSIRVAILHWRGRQVFFPGSLAHRWNLSSNICSQVHRALPWLSGAGLKR